MSSKRTASLLTGNAAATSFHDLLRCTRCTPPSPSCSGCDVVRLHTRSQHLEYAEGTVLRHMWHIICSIVTISLAVRRTSKTPQ